MAGGGYRDRAGATPAATASRPPRRPDRRARDAFDVLHLPGIALAIYHDGARSVLFEVFARAQGRRVVFDPQLPGARPARPDARAGPLRPPASRVRRDGAEWRVRAGPVERVVDATAAGDSFAAAYLSARLAGASPEAGAGHALAGRVVGRPGAIVPSSAAGGSRPA